MTRRASTSRTERKGRLRNRNRSATAALLLAVTACAQPVVPAEPPDEYIEAGKRAMDWTRRFVELGPRPAGSRSLAVQQQMIRDGLETLACIVELDEFVATTPVGALPMRNLIARFGPADADDVVIISGHYDTLRQDGFVGANDGGSSAGLLMALAERLDAIEPGSVWVVFFDGEESTTVWRDLDHTYGSRRLARVWAADGTAQRIQGLINVDMIGDRDLELVYEGNSDATLREQVWTLAGDLGYGAEFGRKRGYIEDDHVPFVRVGVPSLNLIDFSYGPGNSYWHTAEDTLDKLDSRSFAIVLHVIETAIRRLRQD